MEEEIARIIKDATSEKRFRKIRENGMFLSEEQIEILERNHIEWKRYTTMKELLFEIEEVLKEEEDEQLDSLASFLAEQEYYQHTKK